MSRKHNLEDPCKRHGVVERNTQGDCRLCCRESNRRHYRANIDQAKDKQLKRNYGITLEDYKEMYSAQGGRCAVCNLEPQVRDLMVDHNPVTGAVRQLLCLHCNTALGNLRDSEDNILSLLEYKRRYG